MVYSLVACPASLCALSHWVADHFRSFAPNGEGSRIGFPPTGHVAVNDSGWMGDLCGHRSISELGGDILAHTTTRSWHSAVSWPPLCISPWLITSSTCLCQQIRGKGLTGTCQECLIPADARGFSSRVEASPLLGIVWSIRRST